jgi:hypothetical protein
VIGGQVDRETRPAKSLGGAGGTSPSVTSSESARATSGRVLGRPLVKELERICYTRQEAMGPRKKLVEWSGIDGEILSIIAVVLVAVVVGLLMYAGVPDLAVEFPDIFQRETIGDRMRRECESILEAAGHNPFEPEFARRVSQCIVRRRESGR